jgi:hypothetical protein
MSPPPTLQKTSPRLHRHRRRPLIRSFRVPHHPPRTNSMLPWRPCRNGPSASHARNASRLRPSHTPTQTRIGKRNFAGSSPPRPPPQNTAQSGMERSIRFPLLSSHISQNPDFAREPYSAGLSPVVA